MMFVTTSAYVVLDVIVTIYQVQEAAAASSEADGRALTKLYVAENAILRWNVRPVPPNSFGALAAHAEAPCPLVHNQRYHSRMASMDPLEYRAISSTRFDRLPLFDML